MQSDQSSHYLGSKDQMRLKEPTPEPVRVLSKAMAILELLAESDDLGLGQISSALSMNKSTCYRIMSTLVLGEFVERGSAGSYRLGVSAFRAGAAVGARFFIRDIAHPILRDLQRATGDSVYLMIRRHDRAVCLERLDGRDPSVQRLNVGGHLPLTVGACPRILLAALTDKDIAAYLVARPASEILPAEATVLSDVERVRVDGYCDAVAAVGSKQTFTRGVPVRTPDGEVVAAISICGLFEGMRSTLAGSLDLLRGAASSIGAALEASSSVSHGRHGPVEAVPGAQLAGGQVAQRLPQSFRSTQGRA